jgi:uncharacterized protein (DUF1697 family)
MNDLREIFAKLGLTNVSTYIQSGNVVFTSPETTTEDLAQNIAVNITAGFGFEVPVIVLSADEMKMIADGNPFYNNRESGFLHITFLADVPTGFNFKDIEAKKQGDEEIFINGKAIYLYCPHGYGKTKLTNSFLESKLKVTATTRNWKTVNELLRIAQENGLTAGS